MRDAFAEILGELSEVRQDLYLVTADISPASALNRFVKNNPKRVVDAGVSEQIMIGLSAGLAIEGFRVFAYTITNFSLYRPFEQLRVDLAYQELPIVVVGVGSGLSYSALGSTHHSPEDVGVISNLPNFNIVTPSDPSEVKLSVIKILETNKPTYLRLGKAGEPEITTSSPDEFQLGICRRIFSKNNYSSKTVIVTYGPILNWVVDVAKEVQTEKIYVDVYSATSISPFPKEDLEVIFRKYSRIIVVEEHYELTGFGSIIKNKISQKVWGEKLKLCGLDFKFAHKYGSQNDIRSELGLTKVKLKQLINEDYPNDKQ
jgi:transketolase